MEQDYYDWIDLPNGLTFEDVSGATVEYENRDGFGVFGNILAVQRVPDGKVRLRLEKTLGSASTDVLSHDPKPDLADFSTLRKNPNQERAALVLGNPQPF